MDCRQIEGEMLRRDFSFAYIAKHSELEYLERGIPYREFYYHHRARNKHTEFRLLKTITETPEHTRLLVTGHNQNNRYPNFLPYFDTAVRLRTAEYINASVIDGSCHQTAGAFIATQGPMNSTIEHFWSMIWESGIALVVMLCGFVEAGYPKCEQYFSSEGVFTAGDFEVTTANYAHDCSGLVQHSLLLTKLSTNEHRSVKHLQLLDWPDQDAPSLRTHFGVVMHLIEEIKRKVSCGETVAVHCSAGVGRTGTLIALHNLITALEDGIAAGVQEDIRVSVFSTVRRLREQRWGMVGCYQQYSFLYKFIECWLALYFSNANNNLEV